MKTKDVIKFLKKMKAGQPFQVVFIKQNGELRVMNCYMTEPYSNYSEGPLPVVELESGSWRSFYVPEVKNIGVIL